VCCERGGTDERAGQRHWFGGKRMRFSGGSTKRLLLFLLANLWRDADALGEPPPGLPLLGPARSVQPCRAGGAGVWRGWRGGSRVARDSRRKQHRIRW